MWTKLKRRSHSITQTQAAWLLMLPFLCVYCVFMVYPFFRGIWISLHEWNLLAVAFNPDAKEFIGLKNYVGMLWGVNIKWSMMSHPVLQISALLGFIASIYFRYLKKINLATTIAVLIASLIFLVFPGFYAGEGGRWFDRRFWPTVGNTVLFVVLTVPCVTITALLLAAATNRQTRAMAVLRTVFFTSSVLSVTVVTLIWLIMFSPYQGLIANITDLLSGTRIAWLTNVNLAMPALVITTVWWGLGIAMILFLAGLQDISADIYEAAALDNAKGFKQFWYITLPNLKRTITLVVVLQIIAHFQVFGQSHLMTGGGPIDKTQVLVRYIYQTGFRDNDLGKASAMAVFLFVIMGAFSILQFVMGKEKD